MKRTINLKTAGFGILALGALALSACETPRGISKTDRDFYHHNKGYQHSETVTDNRVISEHHQQPIASAPMEFNSATTNIAGCNGSYSLADNSGRVISQGNAYNAPEGLYVLDNRGNRTGQILNAQLGQSLIFRPSCGCNVNSNYRVETQSTGHVHRGTHCGAR